MLSEVEFGFKALSTSDSIPASAGASHRRVDPHSACPSCNGAWEGQDPFGSHRMTFHPVSLSLSLSFSSLLALWQSAENGVGPRMETVMVGH